MGENKVLIVAPSEKVRASLVRALRNEGCSVLTAPNGEEGLSLLASYEVDLVISDQSMPDMTGLAFLTKVKAGYPFILTMLATSYPDTDTVLEALNTAGIYKIILKPWREEELRKAVMQALRLKGVTEEGYFSAEQVKAQRVILAELERKYPGITKVDGYENGVAILKL
jgi:DNA-binding NtrC family response regulator